MIFDLTYPTLIFDVHTPDDPSSDGVVLPVAAFTRYIKDRSGPVTGMGFPVRNSFVNMDFVILPEDLHSIPFNATHVLWFDNG